MNKAGATRKKKPQVKNEKVLQMKINNNRFESF